MSKRFEERHREAFKDIILRNAARINELHDRVRKLSYSRDSAYGRQAWLQACREFRTTHNDLSFPGGFENVLLQIRQNNIDAIEDALIFLELQAYFFRSQYMRQKLTRLLKRAALKDEQRERFIKLPQKSR